MVRRVLHAVLGPSQRDKGQDLTRKLTPEALGGAFYSFNRQAHKSQQPGQPIQQGLHSLMQAVHVQGECQ